MTTEPHPLDQLSPDLHQDLAEMTLRGMRKRLREAYDAATLLTDILARDPDRKAEYDEMLSIWGQVGHAMSRADAWRWAEQETQAGPRVA